MEVFVHFFRNFSLDRDPFYLLQEVILHSLDSENRTSIHYVQDVNYINVWEFEKSLDLKSWREWFHSNFAASGYIALMYLAGVFIGQKIMNDRKPFNLKNQLVIWNLLLGVFSAFGFIRSVPELIYILKQDNGFHSSVCSRDHHNMATAFWWLLFVLSKVAELGDTAFSVLRKKPVTFLAWSHHAVALFICFFAYSSQSTACRWYTVMNYFVHSLMYPYFAVKTLGFQLPKWVPMSVTFVQLFQMIIGLVISLYSLYAKFTLLDCFVPAWQLIPTPIVYTWFIGLFGHLFYTLYIKKKTAKLA